MRISSSVMMPQPVIIPIRDGPCNEGDYSGDPNACDVYYICDHGRKIMFRCQTGLYWNNNQKVCDWPANVDCTASGGGSSGGGGAGSQTTTQKPEYSTQGTTTTTQSSWTQAPTTTTQYTTTTTYRPISGGDSGGSDLGDYKVVCYFTNWAWYRYVIQLFVTDKVLC